MKLSIDFDGTICRRTGIPRTKDWFDCPPTINAKEAVKFLVQKHDVYVCTNRPRRDWKKIKQWLQRWNFPEVTVTNRKLPDTFVYIDDRAVRFEDNWLSICKLFG